MDKTTIFVAIWTAIVLVLIIYCGMYAIENCVEKGSCNPIMDMMASRERAMQDCIEYNKAHNGSYCYV